MRTIKILSTALFVTLAVFMQSCIKPAHEEEFGPVESKSCTDGVLNQGEYFTDCGGPCEPCAINTYVNFKVVDSTWSYPNGNDYQVNSNKESMFYSDTLVTIYAQDTLTGITLAYTIDRNWKGVHALDSFPPTDRFSGLGFDVPFETGVVTITNVDAVNGYISGEFSFNCQPELSTGMRISILEGEFKDIPTVQGL